MPDDNRFSERVLGALGLYHVAHRPPIDWRFWIYSITAYLLPVVVHVVFPAEGGTLDEVVWLIILVPAFLLSLHFGLRGAFAALVVGIALIAGVQLFQVFVLTPGDPRITVPIFIAYGALAISVGWLSEELHDHYGAALELQAAQKTEALGSMAAGIAHDFNNILTAMVANAELIAEQGAGDSDAVALELRDLKSAARRGAGMVRNLLGFSRKGMLELRPLDLAAVVSETRGTLERLLPPSIELELTAADELPPVLADRGAVGRILSNLVTNARDAMPFGGRIEVELRLERLTREQRRRRGWGDPGEYVCLEVRDGGTGMAPETVARIFEPFFTEKEPGEGVGLGMAMVYGLIKQHRGFVDVESKVGRGTRVRVYFPVAKVRMPSEPADERPRPRGGSETILLVEDDETIRSAARRILERFGYRVIEAGDGVEAEELYFEQRGAIDLILTDVMLPRRTGPEFFEAVRRAAGGEPPRVLFMSGYPAHTVRTTTDLDPSLPFVQKPWTVVEFVQAVRDALDDGHGGDGEG